MAAKEKIEEIKLEDQLTMIEGEKDEGWKGPKVPVFIPELEDRGSNGLKVDQYEHVSIANEVKEDVYKVRRGEWVDVPVPVFLALKERYPKI